jgi:hypothetical protein
MPADAGWVRQKLEEIASKRAVLSALKDSLDAWERDVDWGELPEGKRLALLKLARESSATLRTLISRVNGQISAGLTELAQTADPPGRNG